MDTQGPPSQPRYQLTRGLLGLDNEKRCYDVTLSRQEASTMRRLLSAHQGRAGQYACIQDDFFHRLAGRSALTGLAIVHWIGY